MCQPVHPCCNPTPTLKPSISLAALIHVLHHPQIPLPLLTSTCSTTIPLLAPCHMLSLHTNTQTEQLFLTFIFLHPHSQYTLGTKLYSCLLIITSLLNLASVTLFHIMALPFYHLVVLTVLHNCSWQLVPVHFFSISQASLNPLPYLIDFSISPQECHQDQPYFHPSALHSSPDFSVFFLLLKGLHLTILRALRQLLWIDFIYRKYNWAELNFHMINPLYFLRGGRRGKKHTVEDSCLLVFISKVILRATIWCWLATFFTPPSSLLLPSFCTCNPRLVVKG